MDQYQTQSIAPMATPTSLLHQSPTDTSFPIIVIAIVGILATAFLLVGYYIFVIKCCLNLHRIDLIRRFSFSRTRNDQYPLRPYAPTIQNGGLQESVIRSIPIFHFNKEKRHYRDRSLFDCSVCLNEFQEDEKLRVIPNCRHVFHIDCIDIWLQNNVNCPLCRTSVSTTASCFLQDEILAPTSSPQNPDRFVMMDNDYVVIELVNNSTDRTLIAAQERLSFSPKILERRNFERVISMGDECIDNRENGDQFGVLQPIRRSFSMDSCVDRQLCLSIREAMVRKQDRHGENEVSAVDGGSSGDRVKRSFFSCKGSKNAISPVYFDP